MIDDPDPDDEFDDGRLPSEERTVDAADAVTARDRRRRIDRQREEAREFWRRVFADPVGRREMWGILSGAHTFEERFACGPNGFPQTEATWFHAGEQALGLRLYQSWVLLDRDGVFAMQDEHDPRFAKPKPKRQRAKRDA